MIPFAGIPTLGGLSIAGSVRDDASYRTGSGGEAAGWKARRLIRPAFRAEGRANQSPKNGEFLVELLDSWGRTSKHWFRNRL